MGARLPVGVFVSALILVGVASAFAEAPQVDGATSVRELSRHAEALYGHGALDSCLALANLVVDRPDAASSDRVQAFLLQACCHVARDRNEDARRAIAAAWLVEKHLEIDPDLVPPGFVRLYYEVVGALEDRRITNTLAVLGFTNTSVTDHDALNPLGQGIADMVLSRLVQITDLQVVERERMRAVLDEHGISDSSLTDPAAAIQAGRFLAAQHLVVGGFSRIGKTVRVDCRLVKCETGRVLFAESKAGHMDELLEIVDGLAESIGRKLSQNMRPERSNRVGMEALLAYSSGLEFMDLGNQAEALRRFEQAAALSPEFAKARARVRQLAPMVIAQEAMATSQPAAGVDH